MSAELRLRRVGMSGISAVFQIWAGHQDGDLRGEIRLQPTIGSCTGWFTYPAGSDDHLPGHRRTKEEAAARLRSLASSGETVA